MSCDLCKYKHNGIDILCQPCREMIRRLVKICTMNPDILEHVDAAKQQSSSRRGAAEAAGAKR